MRKSPKGRLLVLSEFELPARTSFLPHQYHQDQHHHHLWIWIAQPPTQLRSFHTNIIRINITIIILTLYRLEVVAAVVVAVVVDVVVHFDLCIKLSLQHQDCPFHLIFKLSERAFTVESPQCPLKIIGFASDKDHWWKLPGTIDFSVGRISLSKLFHNPVWGSRVLNCW